MSGIWAGLWVGTAVRKLSLGMVERSPGGQSPFSSTFLYPLPSKASLLFPLSPTLCRSCCPFLRTPSHPHSRGLSTQGQEACVRWNQLVPRTFLPWNVGSADQPLTCVWFERNWLNPKDRAQKDHHQLLMIKWPSIHVGVGVCKVSGWEWGKKIE